MSRLLSSKTSVGNFEFIIKNVNFKNVVGNLISWTDYVLIPLSLQTGFVPRKVPNNLAKFDLLLT